MISRSIQMAVYGILAAILIIDGIRTLFKKDNLFYHSDSDSAHLTAGGLLLSSGGTVIMLGARLIWGYAWTKEVMWIFIIAAAVMMVLLAVKQQR